MLSLHKIRCGSAVSSNVKLCLTFLLLHSPVIIFAQDRLHSAIKEQALIALVANGWLMPLRAVPEHLTRNCNCIQ